MYSLEVACLKNKQKKPEQNQTKNLNKPPKTQPHNKTNALIDLAALMFLKSSEMGKFVF